MKKTKRLISAIVCLAMVLGIAPLGVLARTQVFTDVPSDEWYYDSVYTAYEMGLINGKGDGQYCPESYITIAETLKLAACMHQLKNEGEVTIKSSADVWYMAYLNYCCDVGIIPLYETDTEPGYQNYLDWAEEYITRADFVLLLSKAMPDNEFDSRNPIDFDSIPDIKEIENPYSKAIYKMYRAGILSGSDDEGTFNPESAIQRSEVAAILVRLTDKSRRKGGTDSSDNAEEADKQSAAVKNADQQQKDTDPAAANAIPSANVGGAISVTPIDEIVGKESDSKNPPVRNAESQKDGTEGVSDAATNAIGPKPSDIFAPGEDLNIHPLDKGDASDMKFDGFIVHNRTGDVDLSELPTCVEDIENLRHFELTDPYMVAAVAIAAFCIYPEDKTNAIAMLNYLKGPESLSAYDKQFLNDRLMGGKGYVAFSYFQGATPGNGYAPQTEPCYTITMKEQSNSRDEAGYIKLYVVCNGADSARPIQLRQKASTGEWFVNNYSSLLSGVRAPASADPWN